MARIINLSNLQTFTAVKSLSTDLGAVPGPVVVPSCAQIVLKWGLSDGKTGHNVLYGRYTGSFAGTVTQANGIMTALTTGGPWTALNALLAQTGSFLGVDIRNVNVPDQPILSSTNAAVPGVSVNNALPNEVAAVITLRTALTGRSNRGRMYIPNFDGATLATGNVISAPTVTALQNWANTIINALAPIGYQLVIGQLQRAAYTSPVTGRQFGPRPPNSVPVTALQVRDNHWDSQRRRGLR